MKKWKQQKKSSLGDRKILALVALCFVSMSSCQKVTTFRSKSSVPGQVNNSVKEISEDTPKSEIPAVTLEYEKWKVEKGCRYRILQYISDPKIGYGYLHSYVSPVVSGEAPLSQEAVAACKELSDRSPFCQRVMAVAEGAEKIEGVLHTLSPEFEAGKFLLTQPAFYFDLAGDEFCDVKVYLSEYESDERDSRLKGHFELSVFESSEKPGYIDIPQCLSGQHKYQRVSSQTSEDDRSFCRSTMASQEKGSDLPVVLQRMSGLRFGVLLKERNLRVDGIEIKRKSPGEIGFSKVPQLAEACSQAYRKFSDRVGMCEAAHAVWTGSTGE